MRMVCFWISLSTTICLAYGVFSSCVSLTDEMDHRACQSMKLLSLHPVGTWSTSYCPQESTNLPPVKQSWLYSVLWVARWCLFIWLHIVQVSCPGTYVLDSCQIRIGRLKLQWSYKRQSQRGLHPGQMSVLVHVPPDPLALDIQIHQPSHSKTINESFLLRLTSLNHQSNLVIHLRYWLSFRPAGITSKT